MTQDVETTRTRPRVLCTGSGQSWGVGSGIFALPGRAATMTDSRPIFGYSLAGLVQLPAALSKYRKATGIPESVDTALDIDRAMGPFLSRVANSRLQESVCGEPANGSSDRLDATVLLGHCREL